MPRTAFEITERFLRIRSLDFFGLWSASPDGRYIIAWSDYDPVSHRGGFRESGLGSYVVLRDEEVLVRGHLERPDDGKIANNGVFLLHDGHFGSGYKGSLCAFGPTGEPLLAYGFDANLYNNGISVNGSYAVCQTCHSPASNADSSVLAIFDLIARKLRCKVRPVPGWADGYEIDEAAGVISQVFKDKGVFRYSNSGDFLDAEKWNVAKIDFLHWADLLRLSKQELLEAPGDRSRLAEAIRLAEAALKRGAAENPNRAADAYKQIGMARANLGELGAAIECYEKATALNPKAGVKKRLAALRGVKA